MDILARAVTDFGAHLKCPVCLSLMQEPMSMPCSHTFCRACLSQAIGGRGKCPICKVEATRRTLVPNEQMARFIRYYKELLSTGEDPGGMFSQPLPYSQVQRVLGREGSVRVEVRKAKEVPVRPTSLFAPAPLQPLSRPLTLPAPPSPLPVAVPPILPTPPPQAGAGGGSAQASAGRAEEGKAGQVEEEEEGDTASKAAPPPVTPPSAAPSRSASNSRKRGRSEATPAPPPVPLSFVTPHVVVATSSVEGSDEEKLAKLEALLGPDTLSIVPTFSSGVTHLVVPAKKGVAQKRSLKYIQAILSKAFIVRPEWISACLKAKAVVDETPYVVTGVHLDTIPGGPSRALNSKQPLFLHWRMALRGSFTTPPCISRPDLTDLIRQAGARLVPEAELVEDAADRCAVLCEALAPASKSRGDAGYVVSYKWFLDCVTNFTVLPFTHTPPKK